MYVQPNLKSKKALKDALAAGKTVTVFQPNDMFGTTDKVNAQARTVVTLEGPHYPEPHKWYARVQVEFGRVTKILS